MKTYVSNRVQKLVEHVPPEQWRYVSTSHNPADHASRGLSPRRLLACDLWWQGPTWLKLSPAEWPRRLDLDHTETLPELKATVLILKTPPPSMDLWSKYSTHHHCLVQTIPAEVQEDRRQQGKPFGTRSLQDSTYAFESTPVLSCGTGTA